MREAFFTGLTLLLLVAGPAAAQDIYGIEPGMPFSEVKAELEIDVRSATRDSSDGIYRWTFNTKQGTVTIAASRDAFDSFSEARVQWISLRVSADYSSGLSPQQVCTRYGRRWRDELGDARKDTLSGGTLLRWKRPALQARILCHREKDWTEIILLNEPILLSTISTCTQSGSYPNKRLSQCPTRMRTHPVETFRLSRCGTERIIFD